jgi:hypothetical protein
MSRGLLLDTIFLVVTALVVCPTSSGESGQGQILGMVLDEKGSPLVAAQVTPQFLGVGVMHTLIQKVNTDVNGRFRIEGLDWGPYSVYAGKEADGYPDTRIPLYRSQPAPRIELSPEHPVREVTVKIGPKGGVFSASVRDGTTHARVAVQLTLRRKDGSGLVYLSEPPDFQVLLPSNTDVLVEIRSAGYKPWSYSKGEIRTLRLRGEEHIKLEIILYRSRAAVPKT